jgi:hypothetical protein
MSSPRQAALAQHYSLLLAARTLVCDAAARAAQSSTICKVLSRAHSKPAPRESAGGVCSLQESAGEHLQVRAAKACGRADASTLLLPAAAAATRPGEGPRSACQSLTGGAILILGQVVMSMLPR